MTLMNWMALAKEEGGYVGPSTTMKTWSWADNFNKGDSELVLFNGKEDDLELG